MKAILEFNLPEDEHEFESANQGHRLRLATMALDQWLRKQVKYEEHDEKVFDAYDECRKQIREAPEDVGLSMQMIELP